MTIQNIILLIVIQCLVSCTSVWAQAPAATATPAPRRTGAITGRVVIEDGSLPGGTQVGLTPLGVTSFGSSLGSLADEEGNFTINNLEGRVYRVFASLPGYVTAGEDDPWRHARVGDALTVNLVKGGVITGKVMTPSGDPVIGLMVEATRVRDAEGKPSNAARNFGRSGQTDDRGVYRIYGLAAGSYLITANAAGSTFSASPYNGDKPVYHPANARDTATEVQVQPGTIVSGVDIRYRSEAGNTVSGKIIAAALPSGDSSNLSVVLSLPGTSQRVGFAPVQTSGGTNSFEFHGIANGDYDLMAYRYGTMGVQTAKSQTRRISVRNGDVSGLELTLAPLASIAGTLALEPLPEPKPPVKPEEKTMCAKGRPTALYEVLLTARSAQPTNPANEQTVFGLTGLEAVADDKGAFTLNGLEAGSYRLLPNLPGESWYVKSIATAAPSGAKPPAVTNAGTTAATNTGLLALKAGDKLSGVTVTLAAGAAQLSGKLASKSNRRVRVHLIPAEATLANDVLRYGETLARADGTFTLTHLAPGKYWLLAKPLAADESAETVKAPLAWNATERVQLHKAAEAAAQAVELGACVRLSDYKLK